MAVFKRACSLERRRRAGVSSTTTTVGANRKADFWLMADVFAYPHEIKNGIKFKVFSVRTYELRSDFSFMSKSGENFGKHGGHQWRVGKSHDQARHVFQNVFFSDRGYVRTRFYF